MPRQPSRLTLEAQDALQHLKLARALLDYSKDLTTLMLVDQAISSLAGTGPGLRVRHLR